MRSIDGNAVRFSGSVQVARKDIVVSAREVYPGC
jgi:hypothetical protein